MIVDLGDFEKLTLQNSFLSPVEGFLNNTDMRFLTESKGSTCNTSYSIMPSPGIDTCTVLGDLNNRVMIGIGAVK